jgi:hypothetical protein
MGVLAACADSGSGNASDDKKARKQAARERKADRDDESGGGGGGKVCPKPTPSSGMAATAKVVSGSESPRVQAVTYPHPDYEGRPWSQWGQGAVGDGVFLSALGDHCGTNGNSYIYRFDPASSSLRQLADAFSLARQDEGTWGYGKIHAQMVRADDGAVYVTTYWGTDKEIEFGGGYEGDRLLRIDPRTGDVTDLGVPVERHGVPSLAGWGHLLYGEALDPVADGREGVFFVYDVRQRKTILEVPKPSGTDGYRSVLVDARGRAWFTAGAGGLDVYDPESGKVTRSSERLPGAFLRAASRPAPDGTVYGVTREPDVLFALSPSGQLKTLGPVRGYTASVALTPDGTQLYYVPGAHGVSWKTGTPVVAVDTATGKDRVVVELNDLVEPRLGLRLGGSYGVVLDSDGKRLYVGLNAGKAGSTDTFGEVVLAVVDLD